ncbi:MAG TPA: hypothetical protein VNA17_04235 [Pyrinomonadaceae bacterium]|nr:hypothetical protein [Pyrinomonadaceae bacterium]
MKPKIIFGITLSLVLLASITSAQNSRPPIPYIDRGACPFECCTYRDWTVDKPTTVRSAMRDGSPIAFRLRKGARVKGMTGVVITSQPGEVRVLKQTKIGSVTARPGNIIYLLTYEGEGFHKVWFRGRVSSEETYDTSVFRSVREPKAVWWVKVRNSRGKVGWSREPENFGNKDQCGN